MSQSQVEENKNDTSPNSDESTQIFADGLLKLLIPIVSETENSMQQVFKSQNELSEQIDTLTKELEKFMLTTQTAPPSMIGPVQTLTRARNKLNNINNTLNNIKERIDRMERMATSDNSGGIPDVFSSLFKI